MSRAPHDHVFTIRQHGEQVWKAIVNGSVVNADWPDKGSALAGLVTEQRRQIVCRNQRVAE